MAQVVSMDASGKGFVSRQGLENRRGRREKVLTSMLPSDSVERVLGSRSRTANLRSSSASHLAVNKVSWSSNMKTTPGARTARISGPAHVKCTEAKPRFLGINQDGNHLGLPTACVLPMPDKVGKVRNKKRSSDDP